ncbi:hypothetical protein LXL04_012013 [Taraxacum kok-saghyz]
MIGHDESESERVDLGMLFAILSPICGGSPEKRKRVAFDSLLWWPVNEQQQEGKGQIIRVDALRYIKILRLIYIPSQGTSELLEIHGETDDSMVSFTEFTDMFDDSDWGFGILPSVLKTGSNRPVGPVEPGTGGVGGLSVAEK